MIKKQLKEDNSIGAIVFECTELSVYANVIKEECQIPVFDILSLPNIFLQSRSHNFRVLIGEMIGQI